MDLGKIIKQLRIENGYTQEELGKLIGVKKAAIHKYESGIVQNMKRTTIGKLANIFNVSPSYLLGYTDNNINIEKTPPQLSDGEQKLIELFRQVPKEQQELVLSMINGAIESLNNN